MAKILLVEDEVNIASFIERGLQEFGHTVSVAYNGADGWQLAQDEPFDLLVLDIIMPKMNGLDLCRQYRQLYGYDSPVIMLTALGTTDDIVKGLYAGADDYLVKPVSFQELEARITALLRRSKEKRTSELVCGDLILDCNTRRARRGAGGIVCITVDDLVVAGWYLAVEHVPAVIAGRYYPVCYDHTVQFRHFAGGNRRK